MRKTVTAAGLVVAGVLGTGSLVGQLGGTNPAFAASHHAAGKTVQAKNSTAKNSTAKNTRAHASGTPTARTNTPHADGTVTAVNGNTITVKADADAAGSTEYTKVTTIVVSSATKYQGSTTLASITVGKTIVAEGTVSADGTTLTATSVGLGGPGGGHGGKHGPGGPHADGTVTAVNGDSITVTPDADAAGSTEYTKVTTILLTSTTTYDHGATKALIVAGAKIVAEGAVSADGTTLTATSVGIGH